MLREKGCVVSSLDTPTGSPVADGLQNLFLIVDNLFLDEARKGFQTTLE